MPTHDPNIATHAALAFLPFGSKSLAKVRKAVVAVAGAAAQLVALGLVPAAYLPYVSAGLAVLAAIGVYVVPNSTPVAPAVPADVPTPPAPPAD